MSEYHLNNFGRNILLTAFFGSPFVCRPIVTIGLKISELNNVFPKEPAQLDLLKSVCVGASLGLVPITLIFALAAGMRTMMRREI